MACTPASTVLAHQVPKAPRHHNQVARLVQHVAGPRFARIDGQSAVEDSHAGHKAAGAIGPADRQSGQGQEIEYLLGAHRDAA